MSPIYRYGQPIEVHPGDADEYWLVFGTQQSWEDYVLATAQHGFDCDVERGVANTPQYQRMSETFRYDPAKGGVVVDYPF